MKLPEFLTAGMRPTHRSQAEEVVVADPRRVAHRGLTAGGEVPEPHGCCYRNEKQKPDGRSRQVRLGRACREWVIFQRNPTAPRRGHIFPAENISLLRKHLWRGAWFCTHPSSVAITGH